MNGHIVNVVIATPEGTWDESNQRWVGAPADLAALYCDLLGMRVIRECRSRRRKDAFAMHLRES